MSKSLGNFLTIREILEKYSAEVLRLFIFSSHYRSPLDFSSTAMAHAEAGLNRLYSCLAEIDRLPQTGDADKAQAAGKKNIKKINSLVQRFCQAMDNDFNTAQGLGHIFEVVKGLNTILQALPAVPAQADLELLRGAAATIRELAAIMGLLGRSPEDFITEKQQKILAELKLEPEEIDKLILQRDAARKEKNWAGADKIRDQLAEMNIEIKDGAKGTSWQVKLN
jgi:cysteinyl-tRNA synthetase